MGVEQVEVVHREDVFVFDQEHSVVRFLILGRHAVEVEAQQLQVDLALREEPFHWVEAEGELFAAFR